MLINPNFSLGPPVSPVSPFSAPAQQNDALRIVDSFYSSSPLPWSPPHGAKVMAAARATGYEGPIVPEERLHQSEYEMASSHARVVFFNSQMEPAQTLDTVRVMALAQTTGLLVEASRALERATQAGVHGAVTNFSLGLSPASMVERIYGAVAWARGQGNDLPLQNLARAWNLDFQEVTHSDPAVHGPARAQFQQRLIDHVQTIYQDPILQEAQQAFRSAVDAYEVKGNSVVVSAGNEGEVLQQLQEDNGGRPLETVDGFNRSVLATGAVTSVGALDNGFLIADYSNKQGVNIYACGQLGEDCGTSYAAPRVAAVMAQLHQTHPEWSSAQVEQATEKILDPRNKAAVPQEQPDTTLAFMRSQQW